MPTEPLTFEQKLQDEIARLRNADAFKDEAGLAKLAQISDTDPEIIWGFMLSSFDAVADRLEALLVSHQDGK
jgi:hypothetical protein